MCTLFLLFVQRNKSNELEWNPYEMEYETKNEKKIARTCTHETQTHTRRRAPGFSVTLRMCIGNVRAVFLFFRLRHRSWLVSFACSVVVACCAPKYTYKNNFPSSLLHDLYRPTQNAFETCTVVVLWQLSRSSQLSLSHCLVEIPNRSSI